MDRQVFVTGLGIISPLGLDTKSTWEAATAGRSGVNYITAFDAEGFETQFAAEVKGFDPTQYMSRKEARRMDRFCQFAVVATQEALTQAQLDPAYGDPYRTAVVLGSGMGGIISLSQQFDLLKEKGPKRVSPLLIVGMLIDNATATITMRWGAKGPNLGVVSACASGADAIAQAGDMIRLGHADVVITGGSEAPICPVSIASFNATGALSRRNDVPGQASRPFDAGRDGFVMAEGAAVLILESGDSVQKRGVEPMAELAGYGSTSDAYHVTAPSPAGESVCRALETALSRSGLTSQDVDYINAHGTSTPLNDPMETKAIKMALGERAYQIPISSTKSMTGHLIGAAGAIEAAFCVLAIQNGVIPPTANLEEPDPECDLDYTPGQARQAQVRVALSNSFGFGGHNTVLALKSVASD
jgi:beta-ketoacyl-acyl-carrier-protein synthase II